MKGRCDTKTIIINECLELLRRDDVKSQIKSLFVPIIDMILQEIYPYIYLSILFVVLSFFLILANFILYLRSNHSTLK